MPRPLRSLFVIVFFLSPLHARAEGRVYDLDACLTEALAQHPSVILAQDDVAIADARRRVATAALLPAVTVKADQTEGRAVNTATSQNPAFVQRSYGVQATQTLFAGGKLSAGRRQAELGAEIARLQRRKQELDIRHAVAEAYWRRVSLEQSLAFYKDTYKTLQEDLEKAARHDLGAGRAARIELLATRAQNRETQAALLQTEEDVLEARNALFDALGRREADDIALALETPAGFVVANEETCLRLARDNRPDVKIAEKLIQSARLGQRMSQSAYFPKVDLNGFYGRSGAAYIETDPFAYKKDWNAGVALGWPLVGNTLKYNTFKEHTSPRLGESNRTETQNQSLALTLGDALATGVQSRESRRSLHEEEWRYDKTKRDADTEVRLAVRRMNAARVRVEGAKARLDESEQQLKDTTALLRDDRAHLGDLASARGRLAAARAALAQARGQYLTAVAGLNRAVGVPDYFKVER
jgi:outer membrane protein TolC